MQFEPHRAGDVALGGFDVGRQVFAETGKPEAFVDQVGVLSGDEFFKS